MQCKPAEANGLDPYPLPNSIGTSEGHTGGDQSAAESARSSGRLYSALASPKKAYFEEYMWMTEVIGEEQISDAEAERCLRCSNSAAKMYTDILLRVRIDGGTAGLAGAQ